jgi:hypothetical protein
MLECFGGLWIARRRVEPSASHLLWMAAIFICCLFYGFPFATDQHNLQNTWFFLGHLLYGLGLFFAATVVSPKIPEHGEIDLAAYETGEGKAYKATFIVLMVLALPMNYALIPPNNTLSLPLTLLAYWWSVLATLAVYVVGLSHNVRVRTVCAALAVMLALYGFVETVVL